MAREPAPLQRLTVPSMNEMAQAELPYSTKGPYGNPVKEGLDGPDLESSVSRFQPLPSLESMRESVELDEVTTETPRASLQIGFRLSTLPGGGQNGSVLLLQSGVSFGIPAAPPTPEELPPSEPELPPPLVSAERPPPASATPAEPPTSALAAAAALDPATLVEPPRAPAEVPPDGAGVERPASSLSEARPPHAASIERNESTKPPRRETPRNARQVGPEND